MINNNNKYLNHVILQVFCNLNCQTQDVRFCYLHPGFGSFNLQLFMLCVVKQLKKYTLDLMFILIK